MSIVPVDDDSGASTEETAAGAAVESERPDVEKNMPPRPSWLRRVPDAIAQVEKARAEEFLRPEIETLLRVSERRARQLMGEWGAKRRGGRGDLSLEKGRLLRHLKAVRRGGRLEDEERRVERVVGVLQEARLSRVRVKVDRAVYGVQLVGLPEGVIVRRGEIVVRCRTAEEAAGQLFALAQALRNDWVEFQRVVEGRGEDDEA